MRNFIPLLLSGFIAAAPGQAPQAGQNFPESIQVTLPEGPKKILCGKLAPDRKLTIEFLLQMHDHADGYTTYMRTKDNQDLQAAASLIHHLTAHGVKKAEIERAMRGCGVSNVRYASDPSAQP